MGSYFLDTSALVTGIKYDAKEKGGYTMADKPNAVDEVARFLVSAPSPEAIIAFHPSEEASSRLYELIDAERAHPLSADEKQELDNYIALEYFMEQIKAEAHRRLAQRAS